MLRDYVDPASGLRILVTRGFASFCAYVGVQADHALAGLETLDFGCHFGITLQTWGQADTVWPEGWYWWGWDYGHYTDAMEFPAELTEDVDSVFHELQEALARLTSAVGGKPTRPSCKRWTLDEVFEDAVDVLMNLKTALEQSEQQLRGLLHEVGVGSAGPAPED